MSWSFSGDPSNSALDHVRVLVGDIDTTDQLVQDEIILFQITEQGGDVYLAAEAVCLGLAAKFARKVDTSIESVRVSYSNLSKQFTDMAQKYRQKSKDSAGSFAVPFVSGTSISQAESLREDSDLIQPRFDREDFDNDSPYREPRKDGWT